MAVGLGQHVVDDLEVPRIREQVPRRLRNGMRGWIIAGRRSRGCERDDVLPVLGDDRKADGVVLQDSLDHLGHPREHIANVERSDERRQQLLDGREAPQPSQLLVGRFLDSSPRMVPHDL